MRSLSLTPKISYRMYAWPTTSDMVRPTYKSQLTTSD